MKWFVFSDLHGSVSFCEKIVNAIKAEEPDRILFLGDMLNHGPVGEPERYGPPAIIDMLNGYKDRIVAVMGNCDIETDCFVMHFPMNADYAVMPFGDRDVYMTHGNVYNENNTPPLKDGDILLHGHTHIPAFEKFDGFTYANPGSVSLPKGDSWHSYMIMTEDGMVWKDVDGNVMMERALNG